LLFLTFFPLAGDAGSRRGTLVLGKSVVGEAPAAFSFVRVFHGILMILSITVIMPFGIAVVRVDHPKRWVWIHQGLMILATTREFCVGFFFFLVDQGRREADWFGVLGVQKR
jgi:hypothetical protein